MKPIAFVLLFALLAAPAAAASLNITVIDVENGKSVLLVSPSGETLLIDAGWPAMGSRESSVPAIVAALHAAGVERIDELLITHFDIDHLGDVPALAAQVPIRHIFDHGNFRNGESVPVSAAADLKRFQAYAALRDKIGHTVLHPGDPLPLAGVDIRVVAAGGKMIDHPVHGPRLPNRSCAANPRQPVIPTDVEDNLSVGVLIAYGKFRMLDLADLEANPTHNLACPDNLVGVVDVYNVNVHAQLKGIAPELIRAIHPRAILIANGPAKGGDPQSWPILRAAAPQADIWQAHFTVAGGPEHNAAADFIANPDPGAHGNRLEISAWPDGSFTIRNTRNGFRKAYPAGSPTAPF